MWSVPSTRLKKQTCTITFLDTGEVNEVGRVKIGITPYLCNRIITYFDMKFSVFLTITFSPQINRTSVDVKSLKLGLSQNLRTIVSYLPWTGSRVTDSDLSLLWDFSLLPHLFFPSLKIHGKPFMYQPGHSTGDLWLTYTGTNGHWSITQ